ncbi:hypothetical protein EV356DRAFT_504838 [Viridothelium virens]|uniref:WW domain-containing protein n=1 Tax=Viridothelium virens TaxID=1048519 RepID=A0A6A6H4Q1_VIRVR|nr:hypothetical protein EV356DRAFT_504838 [Viridothelium virens]
MSNNDAPPSYETATSSSRPSGANTETRNGIPPNIRRSMEDEGRPLPEGWVRQFDEKSHHQFFVDTKATPPRSIWHHPYDDEQYLSTLPSEERERVEGLHGILRTPSQADIAAESSDDDHEQHQAGQGRPNLTGNQSQQHTSDLPPRPAGQEKKTFGRRLKDKITNTTHEQREAERRRRGEEELRAYQAHQAFRRAMLEAARTGQPQFVGKGRDGKDIYIEPPSSGYPGHYGRGGFGYPGQAYNPYAQGPYANPDARFIRPADPYYRPYGYGYGGGLGLPLLGGLTGGLLLGSALF